MSLLQISAARLKQTLAWSNSRQSWIERVCFVGLFVAACALWWFSSYLSIDAIFGLAALLVLGTAILLRRGWLKLFGPVLFYDMIRITRRGRYFLMRTLYAGFLLFILFSVWLETFNYGSNHKQASIMALRFFESFMLVQLVAVCILTPAFVAGAVAEEKDRKTMEFLLATDLRNREIVLSKFGSRVANLTLFILTGLPIISFIQFVGGVDPTLVLTGFAATAMTMLGLAGVSILNSVLFKRPRDAIAITYFYLIGYLGLGLVGYAMQMAGGMSYINFPLWFGDAAPTFSDLVTLLNKGNIMIALGKVQFYGSSAAPKILEEYALFHGILAILTVSWAILRLRTVALGQAFAAVPQAGARHKARAPVGELPMLWKEISVEGGIRLNWAAGLLLVIIFLVTMAPGVYMIIAYFWDFPGNRPGDQWFSREMNVWVRISGTVVACLTLLSVGVRASTSIGNERDKQTLDSLLTSPMDSDTILWAKFLGNLLSMRMAWLWLGIIWGVGLITGGLHPFALPLLLIAWFVYASFFTILGLWFSMTARTTMRATVYTMLSTIGLSVGHWLIWLCCGPLFLFVGNAGNQTIPEVFAKFQFGMTPPFALAMLAFMGEDFSNNFGSDEMMGFIFFSILGIFLWGVAALIFWYGFLSPRFRIFTGREEERFPEKDHDPRLHEKRPRRVRPVPSDLP